MTLRALSLAPDPALLPERVTAVLAAAVVGAAVPPLADHLPTLQATA